MTSKTWIEVALNGPWTKSRQPGIPADVATIVAEGIACAKAGACIVHTHAYEAGTNEQTFDWQVYARIIEGIRAIVDVPVYPSIASTGMNAGPNDDQAASRFAHIEELAKRGLLEMAVVDPGSMNMSEYAHIKAGRRGGVYLNPEDHIRRGLELAASHKIHPAYAIYEPGFTRLGAALAQAIGGVPTPVYRFMFSDAFAWGFPPAAYGLDAHVALLDACQPGAPWMIAGLGVDIRPLIAHAVTRGGHVRVGLEDAPHGSDLSNVAWVEQAVALVRAAGSEPASVADVRATLADLPAPGK